MNTYQDEMRVLTAVHEASDAGARHLSRGSRSSSRTEFTPALAAMLSLMAASACAAADRNFEKTIAADAKGLGCASRMCPAACGVSGWDKQEVEVKGELSGNVERVDVLSGQGPHHHQGSRAAKHDG